MLCQTPVMTSIKRLVFSWFFFVLIIRCSSAAFVISCAGDADCTANLPFSSSVCNFSSDAIFERQTCSIGACTCVSGYAATTTGCSSVQNLSIGAQCSKAPLERYPYGAYCKTASSSSSGTVACAENMQFAANAMPPGCKYILPVQSFGDPCNASINWCDSSVGLQCSKLSAKCICSDQNAVWRDGRCTLDHVYGDFCQKDADCSAPTGNSFIGMMCSTGRCVCQSGYVARVLAMRLPPPQGSGLPSTVSYRLMCLNDTISAPSEPGQPCNVVPDSAVAAVGASINSPIRYCWHDSICHRCPGDPSSLASLLGGKCYKLANPPPIPPPLLDVFWRYFTSSTITPTRPPEPSTVSRATAVTPLRLVGKKDGSAKFGDYCSSDEDCHQTAFCFLDLINTVHPPCQAAICVCRHGNEPDTSGTCRPIRHLLVGDKCTNPIFEILPPGTACENSKVVCDSPRFTRDPKYDTQCALAITMLTYGQECKVGDTKSECDSSAGLDCLPPASADPARTVIDTTTRCWCSIGMWDGSSCQVSDYGEMCRVNTDCRGYPLAGVICVKGLCLCQAGYRPFRTLQLILMQRESLDLGGSLSNALGAATLYRQTVCVNENTTRVSSLTGSCSALIDPRQGANLCRDGLFCFRCPVMTDSTSKQTAAILSSGSCRTLNMLSATGLDFYGGDSSAGVMRASSAYESSTYGQPCNRDFDCNIYQQCLKPAAESLPTFANSTYQCKVGYCVCQPNYGVDSNGLCRPMMVVKLSDWCRLSDTNTVYPANAGCYFGRVDCNFPFVAKNGTCQLNVVTKLLQFNQSCGFSDQDVCRMPLVCRALDGDTSGNMVCGCPDDSHIYDQKLSICRQRVFGERCYNDTDCDNGGYASVGLGVCKKIGSSSGTCDCRVDKSYKADVTRWNATSRSSLTASVCLDNIVDRSSRSGILGMCSLRMVQHYSSQRIKLVDRLCQSGLLCYQCPDDRDKVATDYGLCRPLS